MNMTEMDSHQQYAKCISVSKRIRWDIDRDVIRGRRFDFTKKFLPDGLTLVGRLPFLNPADRCFLSQVQGRTYANIFGLVERFIVAKVLEVSNAHWLGDQTALEALVRFSDEELKHQELFRRIDQLAAEGMPSGYEFLPDPNQVAIAVLSKSTWSVLALTCDIELFTQQHYRQSIDSDPDLSDLWRDVFLYHWKEESQHAILDELQWIRENARLTSVQRDAAVDDLIALVSAVDDILQLQSGADVAYFLDHCTGAYDSESAGKLREMTLQAYRWQYIVSGVQDPRFMDVLGGMLSPAQARRLEGALAPLIQ